MSLTAGSICFPRTNDNRRLNDPTAEKHKIIEALAQTRGNITQAAKLLGIGPTTLDYKMKHHGLKYRCK